MGLTESEKIKKSDIIKSIKDIEIFFEEKKELAEQEGLEEIKINLSTAKKEFESDKYFIAIIGGIKTGKSTLINLLCHKEISKTQAGIETTKIPLIISANIENKINIYRKKKENDNPPITDEDRDLVINYIKGLDEFDKDNEQYIVKESEDFDTTKIYNYVTNDDSIDNSSMIIAIHLTLDKEELKEYPNCLLSNDIMIIDTPGLDGIESGPGGLGNNEGDWLVERTDLILILQSTVSPINVKVKDVLGKIKKKNLKSRLIHNQFSLRDWIDKESRSQWENKTRKDSIVKALEILDKTGSYTDCVDLAMASDTVFRKKDLDDKVNDLLEKSGFDKFEKNIYEELKNTKEKDHFESCINRIKNFKLSITIQQIVKDIKSEEKKNEEKMDMLIDYFDINKTKIDYNTNWANFDDEEVKENFELGREAIIKNMKTSIKNSYLTNEHKNRFTEYLLSRELSNSSDEESLTVKSLIEFFNIEYRKSIKSKEYFVFSKEETKYISMEIYIKDELDKFIFEAETNLDKYIDLGITEAKHSIKVWEDDPKKVKNTLKDKRKNYLRNYLRENLKSKVSEIFTLFSCYLKDEKENLLQQKNQEIIRKKEIVEELKQKIDALESKL